MPCGLEVKGIGELSNSSLDIMITYKQTAPRIMSVEVEWLHQSNNTSQWSQGITLCRVPHKRRYRCCLSLQFDLSGGVTILWRIITFMDPYEARRLWMSLSFG